MSLPDAPDRTQVPLDYEPGERMRRRKWRRWISWTALTLTFAALAWSYGPWFIRRAQFALYERRVARYTAPASRVVYEEDPSLWPGLLAQPGYRQMTATSPGWSSFVGYIASPVEDLARAVPISPLGGTAIFAHELRNPSGQRRIVVIWLAYNGIRSNAQGATPDNQVYLSLCTSFVQDAKLLRAVMQPTAIAPKSVAENRTTPLYARLYAGQVDPADASHFTIAYQIGEYSDQLDGYLLNDDSVQLQPRKYQEMGNPK
jgi:hypothetical protein